MARKLKYFDKLLLVIGSTAVLTFTIYVITQKRTSRQYYIPKGYSGWVTIRYEKPNAPPLEAIHGAYRLYIPESGILETSTALDIGWARDDHFWWDGKSAEEIPKSLYINDVQMRHITDNEDTYMAYDSVVWSLPDRADTTLWDGARIDKIGDRVDIRSGRKVLQHFYISSEPKPFFFDHDPLPEARKFW